MNGIVLDEQLSLALLKLSRKKNSKYLRQEALFSLLMYGKLWFPSKISLDNKIGDTLVREGFAEMIPIEYYQDEELGLIKRISLEQRKSYDLSNALSPIIHSISSGGEIVDSLDKLAEELIRSTQIDGTFYLNNYLNTSIGLLKEIAFQNYLVKSRRKYALRDIQKNYFTFDRFFNPFDEGLDHSLDYKIDYPSYKDNDRIDEVAWRHVHFETNHLYDESLVQFFRGHGLQGYSGKSREASVSKYQKRKFNEIRSDLILDYEQLVFLKEYLKLKEILDFSAKYGVPVKSSNRMVDRSELLMNVNREYSYRVYQVMLEEVQYLPRVESLEDVMRLRNNKFIHQFKQVVEHWSMVIREGDWKRELRVRQEIRKANLELKKIEEHEKINGFVTYLALPFIVFDLFIGFPTGSILTAISGAYQFKIDKIKRKQEWLMIGNPLK